MSEITMREIKFRVWDRECAEWQHAEPIYGFFPSLHGLDKPEHENAASDHYGDIQQFTGLKDKTGKEIYEGDLVGIQRHDYEISAIYWGEAEWLAGVLALNANLFLDGKAHCDLEVIGNIYENPELLNVSNL